MAEAPLFTAEKDGAGRAVIRYNPPPKRDAEGRIVSQGMRHAVLIVSEFMDDPEALARDVARILNESGFGRAP